MTRGPDDNTARIIAVCASAEKGTSKKVIAEGVLREDYGLVGDAHAGGDTHRQVSLLAAESIGRMRQMGFSVGPGDFAENLTCQGIDLVSLPVGTRICIGKGIILELTQMGKECHSRCAILRQTGRCIMPTEGVFARVVRGGLVTAEDNIKVLEAGD